MSLINFLTAAHYETRTTRSLHSAAKLRIFGTLHCERGECDGLQQERITFRKHVSLYIGALCHMLDMIIQLNLSHLRRCRWGSTVARQVLWTQKVLSSYFQQSKCHGNKISRVLYINFITLIKLSRPCQNFVHIALRRVFKVLLLSRLTWCCPNRAT